MTEADTRIARTFRPRDWVPLTTALIRIMSFVDGRADLALACIKRDLLEGRLRAALVAPDCTIKMLLEASDWRRRTVHVPHIPAEGVGVEPYEEGRFFIWRADLDKEYPTNPATPASAADRQLYAAGEPEPAKHAGGRPPVESAALPQSPQAGPEPPAASAEATAVKEEAKGQADGHQGKRVRSSLQRLYPNGVPGRNVIGTSALREQVNKDLKPETRRTGLREPSWQTVDRVRDRC